MDQFKCLFENADDETIAKQFAMGPDLGECNSPDPQLLDLTNRAGHIPGQDEGSGPPDLTLEQQNCIMEAIGETEFSELFV